MPSDKKETKLSAKSFDSLLRPVITEKTSLVTEQGKAVFEVAPKATKEEIQRAVEGIWNVKVTKVNIVNRQGKARRFRGVRGRTSALKKAYVSLAEGNTIDLSAGTEA
ncbi:MAG: 50S ribosomal protein L23 [Rickettsiales bacterium]|jgi:large subunit ribosomal protein L23|nr:50S ribosomal protein L23 [Rickettsiales bacterium]